MSSSTPQLGGKAAIALFVAILIAFVAESLLTQYVQTTLGYRHPYFLFYIVHSTFWIIFPLHFLALIILTRTSGSTLWSDLISTLRDHLSSQDRLGPRSSINARFLLLTLGMTVGITLPALFWFAAVSLASISDVTGEPAFFLASVFFERGEAIWNTNAFFAYIVAVKLFKLKWQPRRLLAVIIATVGVLAVVYGGVEQPTVMSAEAPSVETHARTIIKVAPTAPLVGDLLTLAASVIYGIYQVLYKIYATLPDDPEILSEPLYTAVVDEESTDSEPLPNIHRLSKEANSLPFGLHANLLTSTIGLFTMVLLWFPLPLLHYFDVEKFVLPGNLLTVFAIAGIALTGVVFNAGFMVLLGIWGPIVTSVGSLLTIVLVFLSDLAFGPGLENVTGWSMLGCSAIVIAFGVLAYDTFSSQT